MQIAIMRHGDAVVSRPDRERVLSAAGREQVARVVRRLDFQVTTIAASPYARAAETARIASHSLGLTDAVPLSWPLLVPSARVAECADLLTDRARDGLLVVSHLPLVAELVEVLSGETLTFVTGMIVVLRADVIGAHCCDVTSVLEP